MWVRLPGQHKKGRALEKKYMKVKWNILFHLFLIELADKKWLKIISNTVLCDYSL